MQSGPCMSKAFEEHIDAIRRRKPGLYVLASNVPVDHLEPVPHVENVFQVRDGTTTATFIRNVAKATGLKPSTAQRTLPDSWDKEGRRTKRNHDVLIMLKK